MSDIVLTASARFRSLFAVIVAMGVTSAIYSLSLPLFAARLDNMTIHAKFLHHPPAENGIACKRCCTRRQKTSAT